MSRAPRPPGAAPRTTERILEPRLGRVLPGPGTDLKVDWPGNAAGPTAARRVTHLTDAMAAQAARDGATALLLFENGDPALPIVVGLLPSATPILDAVLELPRAAEPVEARVDGTRVVLEGRDEVVLRCGKASITLRRDGQVEVRGVNVKTEARAVNRIRGGKVEIN